MASSSDSLKQELLQAQNTRDQLMKWKILLVAGIGSAALGFPDNLPDAELALCIVPFVCAYVDLLCRNMSIRTKLISAFMVNQTDYPPDLSTAFEKHYRKFSGKRREALEGLALQYSTWAISVAVFFIGSAVSIQKRPFDDLKTILPEIIPFLFAAVVGLGLSKWVEYEYEKQKTIIDTLEVGPAADTHGDHK